MMQEMMKATMMDNNNLAKAYMMAKQMLAATYGEEFTKLSEEMQAAAAGKLLADVLGI